MRFFSRIRFKNLSENKVIKYLGYALGEIVLVVIGILIALQFNNWNNQVKTEAEIEKLFNLVEEELEENLSKFDTFFSYYNMKDSLVSLVLSGQVNRDDYDKNFELRGLIINSREYSINDDAYRQLIERRRDIPEKYSKITTKLIDAYQRKMAIDDWGDETSNLAERSFEYFNFTPPYGNGEYTDLHDYMLNSPLYKGRVRVFRSYYGNNLLRHAKEFYCKALSSLKDIKNLNQDSLTNCAKIHITLNLNREIEELEVFKCGDGELLALREDYRYQNILIENQRDEVLYFEYLGDQGSFIPSGKIPKCEPNELIYTDVVGELTYRIINNEGECLGMFITGTKEATVIIKN